MKATPLFAVSIFLCIAPLVHGAGPFSLAANLPGVYTSAVAWGDYDNDGRLDVFLGGTTNFGNSDAEIAQLWRNTTTGFSNINAALPPGRYYTVSWGDYDNDGGLDLAVSGYHSDNFVEVLRNTPGGFANINAGLPDIYAGSVEWGDFDNDARLDLLITGYTGAESESYLWRNTGFGFADTHAGLTGVAASATGWGDYDNDGRLDILLAGYRPYPTFVNFAEVWRNTGSGFTNINAGLPGVGECAVAWGDYDNDGRLDILIAGFTGTPPAIVPIAEVWRNTGSGFTNISAGLPGVFNAAAAWGDYDNDGRLDILLAGNTSTNSSVPICQVWRNTGSGFANINAGLPGIEQGAVAWGDYDNDGRLDILLAGTKDGNSGGALTQVWRNETAQTNNPPGAPSGLTLTSGASLTFSWNAATDAQTPAAGLTYNLRIGTTPGGSEILSPMAAGSGLRRVPRLGNAQHKLSLPLASLPWNQTLYWSVQAVDTSFAGSAFATEASFRLGANLLPPTGDGVPGDLNGNGLVDQAEFRTILGNYFKQQPPAIGSVSASASNQLELSLTNLADLNLTVLATTNVALPVEQWSNVGPASLFYHFTDPQATNYPVRFYRLRWP